MDASIELYELNRSIIEQQGPMENGYAKKMTLLQDFVNRTNNQFYMMYGKEIGYFTVFVRNLPAGTPYDLERLDMAVFECLLNVGPVYSVELTTEKDAVEIWVKDAERDLLTCMYLFPYDNGVVRLK